MNPDDPLEQLKALKHQQGASPAPPPDGADPLAQLKAMKQARAQPSQDGAEEGVLDKFLNMATVGLHPKIMGVGSAIGDILQHGVNAHPVQSYEQGSQETGQRMTAAGAKHPVASSAAEATGFFGTLAADAPVRAALATRSALARGLPMLPQAVDYAEGAPGFGAALKRIAGSAKTGAATGAVVGGLSSNGTPYQRATAIGAGGLLGGIFGGGSQALGEAGGGLKSLVQNLRTPTSELGELAANRRIVSKLANDRFDPTDLLTAAGKAQRVQSPSLLAHLGGPSMDNLTWLASTGTSPEAAALKQAVTDAQRGEVGLLQRGVTAMSGVPNTPGNQADTFLQGLESARQAAGRADYPAAYAAPPLQDAGIVQAIRRDPDLRAALQEGINVMKRERELGRIQTGVAGPPIKNPLAKPPTGPQFTDVGTQLHEMGVPLDKLIAEGHATLAEEPPPPSISVQLLDYMKQGVQPVIERGLKKGAFSAHDAGVINQKVRAILEAADAQAPEYAAARARQAALFGQSEAGQAGSKAFQQAPEVIAAQRAELTPAQEAAYRTTQTSALRDLLNGKKYGADLSTGLFDTPAMQAQLRASYPNAEALDPYLEQGRTLNRVSQAVTGNSKTAERQGAQGETVNQTAVDAAHMLTSPHRAFYNIPAKLADARNREVKQAMLQALARHLQVPANSPELPGVVEQLLQARSSPVGRDVTATAVRRGTIARGGGILSGLLSGGATQ